MGGKRYYLTTRQIDLLDEMTQDDFFMETILSDTGEDYLLVTSNQGWYVETDRKDLNDIRDVWIAYKMNLI